MGEKIEKKVSTRIAATIVGIIFGIVSAGFLFSLINQPKYVEPTPYEFPFTSGGRY